MCRGSGSLTQADDYDQADTKLSEAHFLLIQTKWLPGISFSSNSYFSSGLKCIKVMLCVINAINDKAKPKQYGGLGAAFCLNMLSIMH